jgi:hypothetical protein
MFNPSVTMEFIFQLLLWMDGILIRNTFNRIPYCKVHRERKRMKN